MKNQSVKTVLLSTVLLSVAGFSGVSSAHNTGAQTLGAALGARDIYRTTCFSWGNGIHPAAVAGEVNGAATKFVASLPSGLNAALRVQALPGGAVVAPGGVASTANFGTGVHYLIVSHTVAAAHSYNADLHCQNAANVHTGTGEGFTGIPASVTPTVDFVRTLNQ